MKSIWQWYTSMSFMVKMTGGFLIGILLGVVLGDYSSFLAPLGSLFLNLLKMIVIPLVVFSLMVAVNHSNPKELGRIGLKIFPFYLLSTGVAVVIGILLAKITNPGAGFSLPTEVVMDTPARPSDEKQQEMGAFLFKLLEAGNEVVSKILSGILVYAPIGVLGITANTFGTQGFDTAIALGKFIGTSYLGVLMLVGVAFPIMMKLFGIKVIQFYKDIKEAAFTSFVTSSSIGTLPITIKCAEKAGIGERVAKLTLPIGATINMNGTAIRFGVAVIFAAEIMGMTLSTPELATIVIIGTMAAVGTAGVPGAGLIGMSIVFTQAGLPIEIVALTAGINILVLW